MSDPDEPEGLDLARQMLASVRNQPVARPVPTSKPRKAARRQRAEKGELTPLGEAMDALISEQGWDTQVNVHLILTKWCALVGPINAEHSKPESYADGLLTVRTDSTAWATNLRLLAPQIVAKLNEALGDGSVTRVNVLGPDAPSWKKGRRSVAGRGPRDTYG